MFYIYVHILMADLDLLTCHSALQQTRNYECTRWNQPATIDLHVETNPRLWMFTLKPISTRDYECTRETNPRLWMYTLKPTRDYECTRWNQPVTMNEHFETNPRLWMYTLKPNRDYDCTL
jgi:hypothetical protein